MRADNGVNSEKLLGLLGGSTHSPLAFSCGLMGVFCSVVQPVPASVSHSGQNTRKRGGVAAKPTRVQFSGLHCLSISETLLPALCSTCGDSEGWTGFRRLASQRAIPTVAQIDPATMARRLNLLHRKAQIMAPATDARQAAFDRGLARKAWRAADRFTPTKARSAPKLSSSAPIS